MKSTTSTARLTVATAKVKTRRPDITELTVPSKWDEEHGGPRARIICLKPDLPMAYLRTHFQFNHRVSIGDPISKWIHAAKAWDEKQSSLNSNSKAAPLSENKTGCEIAPNEPSVPAHDPKRAILSTQEHKGNYHIMVQ